MLAIHDRCEHMHHRLDLAFCKVVHPFTFLYKPNMARLVTAYRIT